jgi:uncharacterized protein YjbJ (UPF0337 family)
MDENRIEGTARNLGGKAQEGFGKGTGNARAQAEGIGNQAAGAAQDLCSWCRSGPLWTGGRHRA